MSSTHADEVSHFQRRNRQFYWTATAILIVIGVFIALTLFVLVMRGNIMRTNTLQQLLFAWAPAPFYLWAVWSARSVFAAFSHDGSVFRAVITNTLNRIGWALTLGAIAGMLAASVRLMTGTHVVAGFAALNIPALTLAVVGFALIAMSGVMKRAGELEAKVAKLDAELQDFV